MRSPIVNVGGVPAVKNAPVSAPDATRKLSSVAVGTFPPTSKRAPSGERPRASSAWITSEVESGSLVCLLSGAFGS